MPLTAALPSLRAACGVEYVAMLSCVCRQLNEAKHSTAVNAMSMLEELMEEDLTTEDQLENIVFHL